MSFCLSLIPLRGGEESKSGISPENTIDMIKRISILPGIEVHGLMTVPPIAKIPEDNRTFFRMLYKLSVDINEQKIDNIKMGELSMGMSGDYQTAIEENATFVRVGTAIFGARDYNK